MNNPEPVSIIYDMQYFIDISKEECIKKYKYDEMDVECAYGNLDQIFNAIFDHILNHEDMYSTIGKCTIYTRGTKASSHKKIIANSGFGLVRVLHSDELYNMVCVEFPKYENNYYPAINLIDVLVIGVSSLINKHESLNNVIIREEKAGFCFGISLEAERDRENAELIEYTISIGKKPYTKGKVY